MHQAFLQSIIETPDDDAPRLIYSDWLDDQGDHDRAEFIRLQCRLAQQAYPDTEDRLRAADLLDAHEAVWLAGFPEGDGVRPSLFERGFVARAIVPTLEAFREHAAALRQTTVRSILVDDEEYEDRTLPSDWPAWCECVALTGLEFSFYNFDPDEAARFVASPHLGNLRRLAITYSYFDPQCLATLAGASQFAGLTHLDLTCHRLTAKGMQTLGQSATFCNLRALELEHDSLGGPDMNPFDAAAVIALSQAESLRNLTRLSLCPNELPARAAAALADSPYLRGLRSLRLACDRDQNVTLEIRPLLGSPFLGGLQHLDLSELLLSAEDVRALVAAPRPASLRSLALNIEACGGSGVEALLGSPWAGGLRELAFVEAAGNRTVGTPCRTLADASTLGELRELNLSGVAVGEEGLTALARNVHLTRLVSLSLSGGSLTRAGWHTLAGAGNLPSLRRLRVGGSGRDASAVEALDDTPLAAQLVALTLQWQHLEPRDVRPFLDRRRWPRLVRLDLAHNYLSTVCGSLRACWGPAVHLDYQVR